MPFHETQADPLHILWTNSTGVDLPESEWHPNPFVPLIKTDVSSGVVEVLNNSDRSGIDMLGDDQMVGVLALLLHFEMGDDIFTESKAESDMMVTALGSPVAPKHFLIAVDPVSTETI